MPIGQTLTSAVFSLLVAYDTCAASNVGWFGYHLLISEKFPQFVKSLVYCADKYAPLTLSGIVTENKDGTSMVKPTATLPAIIEYWLPYVTKKGHRTTLKIAPRKLVSVNTIMGMPMLGPAQLSLDLRDNVVESGVLDCEPFPVTYRPTSQSKPDFKHVNSDNKKLLLSEIATIDDIDFFHIQKADATACRVALANYDYAEINSEPTAKKAKIDTISVADIDHPTTAVTYPNSTS